MYINRTPAPRICHFCLVVVQRILTVSERKTKGNRMAGQLTVRNETNTKLNLSVILNQYWNHHSVIENNAIFFAPVHPKDGVQIYGSINNGQDSATAVTIINESGNANFFAFVINNKLTIQEK